MACTCELREGERWRRDADDTTARILGCHSPCSLRRGAWPARRLRKSRPRPPPPLSPAPPPLSLASGPSNLLGTRLVLGLERVRLGRSWFLARRRRRRRMLPDEWRRMLPRRCSQAAGLLSSRQFGATGRRANLGVFRMALLRSVPAPAIITLQPRAATSFECQYQRRRRGWLRKRGLRRTRGLRPSRGLRRRRQTW